ncbi:MAG: nicotinamide-nucleotide amidohydrolase family protein [Mycoplasma sp.]|nr:nicotinamide-nucleotide amidohydrolase family protein [Mycoplasma sp.]
MTLKIATIESMTGGAIGAAFAKIAGASSWYLGGYIVYSHQFKKQLGLNVENGVINKNFVLQMSNWLKKETNADINIAISGNAGPATQDNKEIGLVYIAFNDKVYELNFIGSRKKIIDQAVDFVLQQIKNNLVN